MVYLLDGQPIVRDGKVAQSEDCCCEFPIGEPTTDCTLVTLARVTISGVSDGTGSGTVTTTGCCVTIDGVYDFSVTSGVPATYINSIPECYGPYSTVGGFDPSFNTAKIQIGCDGTACTSGVRWWVRISMSSRCYDAVSCTATRLVVYESTEVSTDNVRGTFIMPLNTDFSCSNIIAEDCQWPSTIKLRVT